MNRNEEVRDFYERMPYPTPLARIWTRTATSTKTRTVAEPNSI